MTSTPRAALILGGSGRTGPLIARHLAGHGIAARTASRHGSDVFFDWDDPATYPGALAGTDRVYLVTPVLRVRYAGQAAAFLDQAEAAGTRHVTFLSTRNGDRAPRGIDIAAVEAETLLNPGAHAGAIIAGDGSQPTGDIETITGRPPASFEAFTRRNAAAWATPEGK